MGLQLQQVGIVQMQVKDKLDWRGIQASDRDPTVPKVSLWKEVKLEDGDASLKEMKTLKEMEKEHISQALTSTAGNKTKAAKTLGISLRNLYRKIERYNIKLPKA